MRFASLSFFLYSLSLVAVTAGQSQGATDSVADVISGLPNPSATEPTSISTTSSSQSTETTSSTTSQETTKAEPTPTSKSEESTSSTTSKDNNPKPTPTSASTTSTKDTAPGPTKSSENTPSSDNNSSETTASESEVVKTITATRTINGTPVPTTYTTTSPKSDSSNNSPSLNGSASKDSGSGLSPSQKKIIIGVVVGVGGAIVIGVIAVVVWRIHNRRKAAADHDDAADLMSGTAVGSGMREKAPSPGVGGTPFRSTLDQYHNPGPVNAASNF